MSTEPERNIEKQLKAFANKRRAEAVAPFELHQATRNMLQAEVARKIPKSPRRDSFLAQIFAGLWPRVALGASLVAILVLGTWVFFQTQEKTNEPLKLAQTVPGIRSADETAAKAVAPTTIVEVAQLQHRTDQPTVVPGELPQFESALADKPFADRLAGRDADSSKFRSEALDNRAALKSAPAAAPQIASQKRTESVNNLSDDLSLKPSVTQAETPTAKARRYADGVATTGPARSAAPRPTTLAAPPAQAPNFGKEVDQWNINGFAAGSVTQRFARVGSVDKNGLASKTSETKPVLTSFQVEQVGNQLRVIDNDGSTYDGFLQKADANSRQAITGGKNLVENRERKTKAPARTQVFKTDVKSEVQIEQDYFFRVVGTNRSLNRKVIFSGYLLAKASNTDFSKTNLNTTAIGQLQLPSSNQALPLLLNSRIHGTALVGESNAVEIHAVPVVPK